ncbi:SDR family NAD(P)-dependent oxidoreductase [Nocardia sp. NPDC059246]|uniref:SDR family NAD(P)-dependent oxidoreductase n=1 Tax=unclassified Nocardia TaxID=2637762 RepID=UPI0036A50FAC
MGKVDGRVAIVTGAARGMGASHARALVREGARVLLTDVLEEEGQQVAKELGENARFAPHNVTSSADWERVVNTAEQEFGPVGILVNNAGIGAAAPIEATTEAEYRRVVDINQVGPFLGMKAVRPSMLRAGGGSIVNISSVAGLVGEAWAIAYSASKFAVVGMTKVAAKEYGPHGIRVNSVHPGVTETPMIHEHPDSDAIFAPVIAATPLGRIGQPEEVTAAVVFLASDDASFINGTSVVVDGGFIR